MLNLKNLLTGEMKSNLKQWFSFLKLKRKYSSYLSNFKPQINATHEYSNKLWICWLQGEENAPDLVKKCIENNRKVFNNKEVIILTNNNIKDYVCFPDYISIKYQKGLITKTHFSDLLRLEILSNYGGLWIDSTCLATEYPTFIDDEDLFVFQNKERGDSSIAASSWFISAEKNNPIINLTRDLLFEYWKHNNKLYHYFLVHFFFTLATEFYTKDWNKVPFYSNLPCHILQRELFMPYNQKRFEQIKKMSAIHKLTYKFENQDTKNTFYEYLLN